MEPEAGVTTSSALPVGVWRQSGLNGLIEALRRAGFSVGATEAIDAARLVRHLAQRYPELTDVMALEPKLRPVLCKSYEDQQRFGAIFRDWAHRLELSWAASQPTDPHTSDGGENAGRTLSHTSVVREMKLIGNLLPADGKFDIETAVNMQSNWNKKNLKFVVFVQGKQSKKVFALDRTKLS